MAIGEIALGSLSYQGLTGGRPSIVGEDGHEAGEVDLRLLAGRRLESHLEGLRCVVGANRGREPLHRRVGAGAAALAKLARQPDSTQVRECGDALTQILEIRRELARPPSLPRAVGGWLKTACDILADRLRVAPRAPGDRADRQALMVKVQNHN